MSNPILTGLGAFITKGDLSSIPQGTPDSVLSTALKIVFALAGIISIIIITVAGLQMTISQGNPDAVNKSRNAVIYAAIGLAVCVSGYTIVSFVLNKL